MFVGDNSGYFIDLHGNSLKKEKTPEGGKDENVFDIQQGVAIGIFVKEPGRTGPAKVHHANLWGLRRGKYEWLAEEDVETTEWTELTPSSPSYLFSPQDTDLLAEYRQGWTVAEIFPVNSVGVSTHRDHFATDIDIDALRERISEFRDLSLPDSDIAKKYKLKETGAWKLSKKRRSLVHSESWSKYFTAYLYRPFDSKFCFLHGSVVDRPREEVARHMMTGANLGLLMNRQIRVGSVHHFFITNTPTDLHIFETAHASAYLFPLYLYPTKDNLLDMGEKRRPNLSPQFIVELSEKLGLRFVPDGRGDLGETFGPEDVFDYAYAVFHSQTYRERYAEFLKRDFPRLPLTSDHALFAGLVRKGADLVGLHLMTSPVLDRLITRFPEGGDNVVEKVRYDAANGHLHSKSLRG